MIIKIVVACAVWIAVILGIDYLVTKMNNDAVDEKFGLVAGTGCVVIVALSLLRRRKPPRGHS
jgi:hypothetical protein